MAVTAEDEVRGLAAEADRPALIDTSGIAAGTAGEAIHGLVAEARATVAAELALAKTAAKTAGAAAGRIALWGIVAAVLAFTGLLTAVAALVLALAQGIGPVAAATVVAVVLLAAGGIAAWRARSNVIRLQRVAGVGMNDTALRQAKAAVAEQRIRLRQRAAATKARLAPSTLYFHARTAVEQQVAHGANATVNTVKAHPVAAGGALAVILAWVFRGPLIQHVLPVIDAALDDATTALREAAGEDHDHE